MHVRKFESDTLEDALKEIKRELGPDAIILKTVTNKGLKGAFKKKRIEITAAISEKNYLRKSNVDNVLSGDEQDKFYRNKSSYISNMIDGYSGDKSEQKTEEQNKTFGYGALGLNKSVVEKKKNDDKKMSNDNPLDVFLRKNLEQTKNPFVQTEKTLEKNKKPLEQIKIEKEPILKHRSSDASQINLINQEQSQINEKVTFLENKINILSREIQKLKKDDDNVISELRKTLLSLDISKQFVDNLTKTIVFELRDDEIENFDYVFEYALKKMLLEINMAMPSFSNIEDKTPTVTLVISETSNGQSTIVDKIVSLKDNFKVIEYIEKKSMDSTEVEPPTISNRILGINKVSRQSITELISAAKDGVNNGESIIIDYRSVGNSGQLIEALKRCFQKVEILISVSAIHSELYNKSVINKYRKNASGILVSHLDLCSNYGHLFNLSYLYKDLPYMFFGTGEIIPDDIEAATPERILNGLFQLS